MSKIKSWKLQLAVVCGFAGMIGWVFQILWAVLLHFQSFFESSIGQTVFPTDSSGDWQKPVVIPETTVREPLISESLLSSPIFVAVMVVIGLIAIAGVIYVLFFRYVPSVGNSGERAVMAVAERATERTLKSQKHVTKKQRLSLTARNEFFIKICISLALGLIIILLPGKTDLIPVVVAIAGVLILTLFSVVFFTIQYAFKGFDRSTARKSKTSSVKARQKSKNKVQ